MNSWLLLLEAIRPRGLTNNRHRRKVQLRLNIFVCSQHFMLFQLRSGVHLQLINKISGAELASFQLISSPKNRLSFTSPQLRNIVVNYIIKVEPKFIA